MKVQSLEVSKPIFGEYKESYIYRKKSLESSCLFFPDINEEEVKYPAKFVVKS